MAMTSAPEAGDKKKKEFKSAIFKGNRKDGEDTVVERSVSGLTPMMVCEQCWTVVSNGGLLTSSCPKCGASSMSVRIYHESLKCFIGKGTPGMEAMKAELERLKKPGAAIVPMNNPVGIQPKIYCIRCENIVEESDNIDTYCPQCFACGPLLEVRLWDLENESWLKKWDGIPKHVKDR